jgi:hypothetical protein
MLPCWYYISISMDIGLAHAMHQATNHNTECAVLASGDDHGKHTSRETSRYDSIREVKGGGGEGGEGGLGFRG